MTHLVPIEQAIYQGNKCPVCSRYHREASTSAPTAIAAKHAAIARSNGTHSYDYDSETWVTA